MTVSQSTAQKVQQQLPPQALEKEFVYNLQQQVYFLELQGKLLREKMSESKQQKSRGVEANPLFDAQLDESLPLTQLFEKLKMHFAQQVKESKDQVEVLKKDIDSKELQIQEYKVKLDDLTTFKENFNQTLADKQKHLNQIIADQQLKNENDIQELEKQKIKNDLQASQIADLQKVNKQLTEQSYQYTAKIKELTDKLNLMQTNKLASEQLQSELSRLQFEFQQIQQKLQVMTNENIQLKTQNQQIKNEDFKIKSDYEVAQMEIKNLNNQIKMLQSEIQTQTQSLSNARTQNEHLTQNIKAMQSKLDQLEQFKYDMNKVIEAYNNKRKTDQLVEERDLIQQQFNEQVNNNKILQARVKELELDVSGLNSEVARLTTKINKDQQELTEKQANYNTLVLLNSDQEKQLEDQRCELVGKDDQIQNYIAKIDFLESELAMKQELSNMQLEEFENMRKSNANLAAMLENLQQKFTNLGKSGQKFVSTTQREIEKEKKVARAAYNCEVEGRK